MKITTAAQMEELRAQLPTMPLHEIAKNVRENWGKVYFGAVPYLEAMDVMDDIEQNYLADTGSSIVVYFLGNATTWRGEVAREIKAELNDRLAKLKAKA